MSYTLDADWSAAGNSNGNRGSKVGFCIHHSAGTTIDMVGTWLANETSAHYGIQDDHVRQFLSDDVNAWAAHDEWANDSLIHIECVNSEAGDPWPVSESTVDTLVEFLADKCNEHGWTNLTVEENFFGHRDFYATYCPGVLYARLGEIADRVNARLAGEDEDMATPKEIADAVWASDNEGTTAYWRIYAAEVRSAQLLASVEALTEAVRVLAGANGADPDAVAKAVSDAVDRKLASISIEVKAD